MERLPLILAVGLISCPGSRAPGPRTATPPRVLPFAIRALDISLRAEPKRKRITMRVALRIDNRQMRSRLRLLFTRPAAITRAHQQLGAARLPLAYAFETPPATPWRSVMTVTVPRPRRILRLVFEYRYDARTFTGWAQNPATLDRLYLGQLTQQAIYASHLLYYPQHLPEENGYHEQARLRITCPPGWIAVSAGRLARVARRPGTGERTFRYRLAFSSGRLPYPLAIHPYRTQHARYQGRLPVTIYHAAQDAAYAREKLRLIQARILPFLERVMGPFPFARLRVVEVFPSSGNTGLAARSLVMLSQQRWFAAPIGTDLVATPATVLVDEIAHQWNYYKVKLPNYLAEGVSEFTDLLYLEHVRGSAALEKRIASYRAAYRRVARLLKILGTLKKRGLSLAQAAATLKLKPGVIRAFWKSADHGELPISDPRTFAALYFIKGALALVALRATLGDQAFFQAFRALFRTRRRERLALDDFRRVFEQATRTDLRPFFDRWYRQTGLPGPAPAPRPRPTGRRPPRKRP